MECVIVYLRIDNKIGYLFFYGGGILRLNQCLTMEVSYDGGSGAKHNLISPNDATSYFTISGKSLPKYISR